MNHAASPDSPIADSSAPEPRSARPPIKLGPIQAASGAIFALFLILHLATAASGLLGIKSYDSTLGLLRRIYRPHVAVELIVIGTSGSIHIACAIWQMIRRRKIFALKGPLWMRAHRLSGYFLLLAIVGHVLATRVAPTLATGPTATGKADFAFLAYATLAAPYFFWPYYVTLAVAGCLHLGLGLHLASRVLGRRTAGSAAGGPGHAGPSAARLVVLFGFTAIVAAGVLGILARAGDAPRHRFPEYKALADKLLP